MSGSGMALASPMTITALRRRLAALAGEATPRALPEAPRITFGLEAVDEPLGGGLPRAALHEVFAAETADGAAAAGFALALLLRAVPRGRPVLWAREAYGQGELGAAHPPGLAGMGADPADFLMIRLSQPVAVLRAGVEALRCAALGAVVLELWRAPRALDLAATRRLALAAGRSGVTGLLLRIGADPAPSAALTRWSVRAAASTPLAAGAPGHPAFEASLLRHRAGIAGRTWHLEWNRDVCEFREPAPLSRGVVSVPDHRPAAPDKRGVWRRSA